MLTFTFDAEQPVIVESRGRHAIPWENELAPIREAVEMGQVPAGKFILSETFAHSATDPEQARKDALALAGKLKRRLKAVGLDRRYSVRTWPLAGAGGTPDPTLGFGVWVSYTPPAQVKAA